ncbi:MAG TPA: DapH/DapD/GlmU-related protein [Polyangiaceae bacterium]|nr:DapH/DapD/GlmU-related protein [Polyangiaceae bacterium]
MTPDVASPTSDPRASEAACSADTALEPAGAGEGLWQLILSDIRRKQEHYVLVNRFFNKYVKILMQHGTIAVVVYRLGHFAYTRRSLLARWFWLLVYKFFALPVTWISRIHINPRVAIGRGFVIHNFSLVFIDARRIGSNFTINQGVTVGPDYHLDGLPSLGDNVFIGAGACLLGAIDIGDNVVVAANCFVARSLESNCVAAGCPGRIVMRGIEPDYVGNVPAHLR